MRKSELFFLLTLKNSEIVTNYALTKAVIIWKTSVCSLVYIFLKLGYARNLLNAPLRYCASINYNKELCVLVKNQHCSPINTLCCPWRFFQRFLASEHITSSSCSFVYRALLLEQSSYKYSLRTASINSVQHTILVCLESQWRRSSDGTFGICLALLHCIIQRCTC